MTATTKTKPRLDERFIMSVQGKDFVLYSGLLDLAHQQGLTRLEVELIQYPTEANGREAICRAVATSKSGETFTDLGDANPNNCSRNIVPHLIRMASTRAKARALRDLSNIGMTALEELAGSDDLTTKPEPKGLGIPELDTLLDSLRLGELREAYSHYACTRYGVTSLMALKPHQLDEQKILLRQCKTSETKLRQLNNILTGLKQAA